MPKALKKVVTKKAAKTPVDPVEQKRKELKRLEKLIQKARWDYQLMVEMEREVNAQVAELKKVAAADGDVLGAIISAATALIAKHYPTAYSAHLDIHLDPDALKYVPGFRLAIPTPARMVPSAGELKSVVKRYASATHPEWEAATVTIVKGTKEHGQTERAEVLLVEPAAKSTSEHKRGA